MMIILVCLSVESEGRMKIMETLTLRRNANLLSSRQKNQPNFSYPNKYIFLLFLGLILHISMVTEAAADEPNSNCGCTTKTEEQSSSPSAGKLINCNDIMKGFEKGQERVKVIVNLAEPVETKAKTDWHSKQSLKLLQDKIKVIQTPMLSALSAGEFKLRYRFDNQAGFSGEVTLQGLEKLKNDPRVISVEPVYLLEPHLRQGISLMHADTYRSSYNGAGIAIAICDTGIDYRHPMLGNGGFPNNKVIGGYDYGDSDADPMPDSTQAHGTCCAGIAAGDLGSVGDYMGGVAYNAKLYALKITFGSGGSAYNDAMVAAWNWCVTHKNDNPAYPILVISTSFGGGRNYSTCDSYYSSMTTAANDAVAAGITVLASSGNDGYCDSIAWPSCISSVISVGAVYDAAFGTYYPCISSSSCATKYSGGCSTGYYAIDNTAADMVTSYSNTASFLTVLAPSNQCYTTDIINSGGYSSGDYYSSFGGTSAACPYAAGAVACLQSTAKAIRGSYLSPSEVRTILTSTGDNIIDNKVAITKPRVNLGQAIDYISYGRPPTANDINVTTLLNTAITITLQAADEGLPNPPGVLSYIITSLPTTGSLSDPGAGGITAVPYTLTSNGNQVIYTPATGYVGPDNFIFKANDGGVPPDGGDSNIATVSINIIDAIYMANMDTNPGWTLDSLWQWGAPTGSGGQSGNHDPTAGYTGANVVGYNLLGDYENSITSTRWAKTPAINCTNRAAVTLTFYRWLNVERPKNDHAYIQVSNNGSSWSTIWENPSVITDSSWTLQTFDISAIADNQLTVYIRWGMGTTNSSRQYSGWNIDDVKVTGITPQMQTLTISSVSGGSTIPAPGTHQYSSGTVVDINAIPDLHYHFVNWTGSAVTAGKVANPNSSSTTVLMDANYVVQANFAITQYTITASSGPNGLINPSGAILINYGASQDYNAIPNEGYEIDEWFLDGNSVQSGGAVYTLSNITANHAVYVTFKKLVFEISGYVFEQDGNTPVGDVLVRTDNNDITLTDANGYYKLLVDYGWSGSVTPQKEGYNFEPNSIWYNNVVADEVNNYTATLLIFAISGCIKNECNVPIEGVVVSADSGGYQGTTDVNGFYEVRVDYGWSGTITPAKKYYTFEPNGISYVVILADQPDQNYVAYNIYDLDCDGSIGWGDVAVIADNWLLQGPGIPGDFDADEIVNFLDFAEFGNVWQDR